MVYASDRSTSLSLVRKTGWIPNPGDIYLLGTEKQKSLREPIEQEEIESVREKAREQGVAIIWTSKEGN